MGEEFGQRVAVVQLLHLCRAYKDVYPRPQNATGSILLFGCMAKEGHAASDKEAERREHHH